MKAIARAQQSNDFLAEQVARRSSRLAGFASLPMHPPKAACRELERAVRQLGMKGALVNVHTSGVHYDDSAYDAFWECMQALDASLYLHSTDSYLTPHAFSGHPEFCRATWVGAWRQEPMRLACCSAVCSTASRTSNSFSFSGLHPLHKTPDKVEIELET